MTSRRFRIPLALRRPGQPVPAFAPANLAVIRTEIFLAAADALTDPSTANPQQPKDDA